MASLKKGQSAARMGGVVIDEGVSIAETPLNDIAPMVRELREVFKQGVTLPLSYRKAQLLQLYKMVQENMDALIQSVQEHMKRPKYEVMQTEISFILSEVSILHNNLEEYAAPKRMSGGAAFLTDKGEVRCVPRGCVLVMGTWNFPLQFGCPHSFTYTEQNVGIYVCHTHAHTMIMSIVSGYCWCP